MEKTIKIMHIDRDYRVIYILINKGILIKSTVSLETAINMLKSSQFDLILSEPQQIAILSPLNATKKTNTIRLSP